MVQMSGSDDLMWQGFIRETQISNEMQVGNPGKIWLNCGIDNCRNCGIVVIVVPS